MFLSLKKLFKAIFVKRSSINRATSLHECLDVAHDYRRRNWRRCRWAAIVVAVTAMYYMMAPHERTDRAAQEFVSKLPHIQSTRGALKSDLHNTTNKNKKEIKVVRWRKPSTTTKTRTPVLNSTTEIKKQFCILPTLTDKRLVLQELPNNVSLETIYPMVKKGGYYHPPDCSPQQTVGILVPYRDREVSLTVFLYNIHPFLMRQKLAYQIFVVEQDGYNLFNKGRVLNAGFKEMLKFRSFDCVVIHDVDLVPLDERISYACPSYPRHMSAKIRDEDLEAVNKTSLKSLFGGVVSMTVEQYKSANGYSNVYFGWGGEDNDMFYRLHASGYPIVRYNKTIAVFAMLPHKSVPENADRNYLLRTGMERYKTDGLSNIEYTLISTDMLPLYTRLLVDIILPTDLNIPVV